MSVSPTVYRGDCGSTTVILRAELDIPTATALGVFSPFLWWQIDTTICPSSGKSNTASASQMELAFQVKLLQPVSSAPW